MFIAGSGFRAASLNPSTDPLTWPALPAVPALAIVLAVIAGIGAPPPLRPARTEKVGPRIEGASSDTPSADPGLAPPPPLVEVTS